MFLIFSGVNTSILNEKKQAPIHLITELNKVRALEVLSKHRSKIDIQQGGEHGRTALHLTAIYDYEECARILVSFCDISLFCSSPRQTRLWPTLAFSDNWVRSVSEETLQQWILSDSRSCQECFLKNDGSVSAVGWSQGVFQGGDDIFLRFRRKRSVTLSSAQRRHKSKLYFYSLLSPSFQQKSSPA